MIKHLKPRPAWQVKINTFLFYFNETYYQLKEVWKHYRLIRRLHKLYGDDMIKAWETDASEEIAKAINRDIIKKLIKQNNIPECD